MTDSRSPDVAARTRLVLLEGDPVLRESITAVLRNEGFAVEVAEDRASLLRIAAASVAPALVLLDLENGGSARGELAAELRRMPGWDGVHVGGMTPDRALARGAHPELSFVLHKPFTVDELFDRAYSHAVAALRGAVGER